jgi:glutaredoxin
VFDLKDDDLIFLRRELTNKMKSDVQLFIFNHELQKVTELEEIAKNFHDINNKINVLIIDSNNSLVKKCKIEIFPTIIITSDIEKNNGVRYTGIPRRYMFSALIEDIINVSNQIAICDTVLQPPVSNANEHISVKMYVDSACPYCPRMSETLHSFSIMNSKIEGNVVISEQFPDEVQKDNITHVPTIAINDQIQSVGYVSQENLSLLITRKINNNELNDLNINSSRLKCVLNMSVDESPNSIVDYRNNLFMGNDPKKIIEFYNGFENRDQLIRWMKERPKGASYIHEVEGDKDIIVVITTADFEGKYAKECRENIFKGLHMIFVESGGRDDFYFNYAHNCNVGIKRAMEYNPKWVVVSNDDMIKIDDATSLKEQINSIDNSKINVIFTNPSKYHSFNSTLGMKRLVISNFGLYIYSAIHHNNLEMSSQKIVNAIEKKYKIKYVLGPRRKHLSAIFFRNVKYYKLTSCFTILSSIYCNKNIQNVYDEIYINGCEDVALSLKIGKNCKVINYRIGDEIGKSLGVGFNRHLRDKLNFVYLNLQIDIKSILL